jgi:hypothetical protein
MHPAAKFRASMHGLELGLLDGDGVVNVAVPASWLFRLTGIRTNLQLTKVRQRIFTAVL